MKVIFLEINGVLNTAKTKIEVHNEYVKTGSKRIEVDLNRVELLKQIVDQTGAEIVLSSKWRNLGKMENGIYVAMDEKMEQLLDIFQQYQLSIYDVTPILNKDQREKEIQTWMIGKNIESFIIFAAESYDLKSFLHKELIQTSFASDYERDPYMELSTGLCKRHVREAIQKLNPKKQKVISRTIKHHHKSIYTYD